MHLLNGTKRTLMDWQITWKNRK